MNNMIIKVTITFLIIMGGGEVTHRVTIIIRLTEKIEGFSTTSFFVGITPLTSVL